LSKRPIAALAFLLTARAAVAACPCEVEGMTLSDEEMAACNGQVTMIRAIQSRYSRSGMAVPPGEIDSYKRSLKTCVDRQRQQAQQHAQMKDAVEKQRVAAAKYAEQARAAQAEKEAARAEEQREFDRLTEERSKADLERQRDPKIMSIAASAQLCWAMDERAEALKAIAEEQRYAKRAGVVNLSSLQTSKTDLREAEESIASNKAIMKKQKWAALSCKDPLVVSVKKCLPADVLDVRQKADPDDLCQTEKIQAFLRLVNL